VTAGGALGGGALVVRRVRSAHRRRERTVVAVLAALVAALAALSLCVGGYGISPADVARTLLGQGEGLQELVVMELRLPRLTMAALVGVALALSGALFQSILDNPLASPDIVGITAGASVGAVSALLVLGVGGLPVSAFAFAGALVAALAIYLLAWRDGVTGDRFVLIGIGVAFMANAVVGYLLTRSDVRDAHAAFVWLVGSVGSARWDEVAVLAGALALLVPAAALLAGRLRALQLGDDAAVGLGVRAQADRLGLIVVGVALAAVATAAAGPVAFVALISAPIARRLVGTGGLALVPAALVGVATVTAADFAAQHLLPGALQAPAGVVTGAIGAPYLLWLLAVSGRRGAGT
jgi:iron complex transport system permease protein